MMTASIILIVVSALAGFGSLAISEDELRSTKIRNRGRVFATVLLTTALLGVLQLVISSTPSS